MDPHLRAELDAVLRASPLALRLGMEVVDWHPGAATVRFEPGPDCANLVGSVHGGALFALADAAFETACNSHGRVCVAVETTCHYAAAAPVGRPLVAVATEISRSRRLASYRIEIRSAGGQSLHAAYLALSYRTDRWHLGAESWPRTWRAAH